MKNIGRRFTIGDIHGCYKGFKGLLDTVNFDYEIDTLICLGDIVDGWSEIKECLDLMLKIKNLVFITGNHDEWVLTFYKGETHYYTGEAWHVWLKNGGVSTLDSLGEKGEVEQKYLDLLESSVYYHEIVDTDDTGKETRKLFVHAGVDLSACKRFGENNDTVSLDSIKPYNYCWDRDMIDECYLYRKNPKFTWGDKFETIYLGHSPTINYNNFYVKPQKWGNVWNVDTGSAFEGRLSLMDIDTDEIWQTIPCRQLYPEETGRNDKSWKDIKRFG